jgi:hypothetical protein
MNSDEYEQWVAAARARLQAGMDAARERFGIGTHARYETDLEKATIRFFDASDVEQVRAEIQVAGSWSPGSGTWMWGWENESAPEAVVSKLGPIVEAGRDKDVKALQAHVVECDEGGAWDLAALAADIVDAPCVYRVGAARNRTFLLLFDLRPPA